MAKAMYIGVNGIARKVKSAYIGVNGVARKIKKMYVGVADKARLFFSGGLEKKSNATALSIGREYLAGTNNQSYGIFIGGQGGTGAGSAVDAYNSSLVKSNTATSGYSQLYPTGCSVGEYALSAESRSTRVYAFNNSLVYSTPPAMFRTRGGNWDDRLAGTNNSIYGFFGGGTTGSYGNIVDAYNASLVRSNPTNLLDRLTFSSAERAGDYALFAGGYGDEVIISSTVEGYDTSLVKTARTPLSSPRYNGASASVNGYAIFAGGITKDIVNTNKVDAYNPSLVRTTLANLSTARSDFAGVGIGDYAIFGGGRIHTTGTPRNDVDIYDSSLVKSSSVLSSSRAFIAGTSVGSFALFGGGSSNSTLVDVYEA